MRILTARPLPLESVRGAVRASAPSTRLAIAVSAGSMLMVAVVSATPDSPFHPVLPTGGEPYGPLRWIADLMGLQYLSATALMVVGLLVTASAAAGFVLVLREAWNGRITMRMVVILALAYHALVIMLPLLFSRDVYSYAYYGRLVSTYRVNPYVLTPSDYPLNSLWEYTWPGWRTTPSVYGPLFTWVSALLTSVTKSIPSIITGFQLLAAAASIGTMAILAWLVQRVRPERALFAVAIIGLNPIVVFHVVGGGHNDMMVAFFVAAAVALLFARRELLSAIALGLGMSVKASAVIPLVLLIIAAAASVEPARRRRVLATYGGVVAGVWLALALPFLQAENPTLGLAEVSGHGSWMAPGQLVVRLFSGVGGLLGGDAFREPAMVIARLLLFAAGAAGVALIARRIWRDPRARDPFALTAAWGWALLVVILPSPVLFTWYVVWTLPLAWAMPRVARRAMIVLSAFFVVSQLVTEVSQLPEILQSVRLPFGHPIAIAVFFWVGRDFYRRMRDGTPLHEEVGGPEFGDVFEAGPIVVEDSPAPLAVVATTPVSRTVS